MAKRIGNSEANDLATTNALLRVVIALMLRRKEDDSPSLKQQIKTLNEFGIRPSEIAAILGRSSTYINKELSGIRKKG